MLVLQKGGSTGYLMRAIPLCVILTYSVAQSPSSEANWFAASQEIPRISRNPKVHYRTHKRPPPVSILGQPNPVHIPTPHLLEIHSNIIHPSTPRSFNSSSKAAASLNIGPAMLSVKGRTKYQWFQTWLNVHFEMLRLTYIHSHQSTLAGKRSGIDHIMNNLFC